MEVRINLKDGTAIELDCVDLVGYGEFHKGVISFSHLDGIEDYSIEDIKDFEIVEKSKGY